MKYSSSNFSLFSLFPFFFPFFLVLLFLSSFSSLLFLSLFFPLPLSLSLSRSSSTFSNIKMFTSVCEKYRNIHITHVLPRRIVSIISKALQGNIFFTFLFSLHSRFFVQRNLRRSSLSLRRDVSLFNSLRIITELPNGRKERRKRGFETKKEGNEKLQRSTD